MPNIASVVSAASRYLNPLQLSFFRSQMYSSLRKPRGFRWPNDVMLLFLQLHYKSTAAYSFLSGKFSLPSHSTLLKFVNKSVGRMDPGFSTTMLNIARLRSTELSVQDRQCALVFDEMSLKCELSYNKVTDHIIGYTDKGQLATHALVFMLRGLHTKWKQAIAYYLTHTTVSAKDLAELITVCIQKLDGVGLHIRCVVCDQAATNISALRQLGFREDVPQLTVERIPHVVHVVFDVPHLMKNVRNNFQRYDVEDADRLCSWSHVQSFYDADKVNPIRLAPRLSDTHFDVSSVTKMRVKYAVQVLSHSVAAGINTHISTSHLTSEAKYTADFIEKLDTLFDLLNFTQPFGDKPARRAITSDNDVVNQLTVLKDWLGQLKWKNVRAASAIKCLWGLQVSITSIVALSQALLGDGFKFVCTARFNQDCIENFFAGIRSKQGWHENPNSEQFSYAFRKSIVLSSLDASSSGKNCIADEDFVLVSYADLASAVTHCETVQTDSDIDSSPDISSTSDSLSCSASQEVVHFDIPCEEFSVELFTESEETLVCYLAGWVSRKCGICRQCQDILTKVEQQHTYEHSYSCRCEDVFASKKRYDSACSVGLVLPCSDLCEQVRVIEQQFRIKYDEFRKDSQVAQKLYDHIYPLLNFSFLFLGHPEHALYLSQKITKVYIIMRIFYAVKFVNRDIAAKKHKLKTPDAHRSEKTRKMKKVMHR